MGLGHPSDDQHQLIASLGGAIWGGGGGVKGLGFRPEASKLGELRKLKFGMPGFGWSQG